MGYLCSITDEEVKNIDLDSVLVDPEGIKLQDALITTVFELEQLDDDV